MGSERRCHPSIQATKHRAAVPAGIHHNMQYRPSPHLIPMRPESVTKIYDVDKSLVVEAFRERIPGIQACGSVPALLTGSSQSFTVTLYTGSAQT